MSFSLRSESIILLAASNLWYMAEGMLVPFFAVFSEKIGGDIMSLSGAQATYLFVTGIAIILLGRIADRVSKERLLLIGYTLNAPLTFGYLFISTPTHLFILQAGLGLAAALATPTWYALYDQYSGDGKNDGTLWGLASGSPSFVGGCAVLAGGYIISTFGFDILFIIMGCIQLCAVGVQVLLPPSPRSANQIDT